MHLFNSCSVPFGFQAVTLPGRARAFALSALHLYSACTCEHPCNNAPPVVPVTKRTLLYAPQAPYCRSSSTTTTTSNSSRLSTSTSSSSRRRALSLQAHLVRRACIAAWSTGRD